MVSGRKMLLADDSITIQKVIDLTFADEGMQVTTVSNGEQAIEKLEEVAPDIVLADVFMPGRNGYEVCEHIKRDERFRHIPVMLLVGSFEPFDEAEARRVGADDFLTKPFQSIRQLVNKVGALLSGAAAAEDEATTRDLKLPAEMARSENQKSAKPTELSMADTAPLPQIKGEAPASASASDDEQQQPAGHASFDDEMIEAAPASSFSSADGDRQTEGSAPQRAAEFEEVEINPAKEIPYSQMQETIQNYAFDESEAASVVSQPAAASPYMAQAAAADEALLDLGDIEPPPAAAEADDFILDLMDESPQPSMQPQTPVPPPPPSDVAAAPPTDEVREEAVVDFREEMGEATVPQVEEFAEAPAAVEEPRAELTTAEEFAPVETAEEYAPVEEAAPQVSEVDGALLETDELPATALAGMPPAEASSTETTTPPAISEEQDAASSSSAASMSSQIKLEQLSPEVIDAIARRAVEQLSEKVIQEIAWEVVPQLAELLIKRKLEENSSQ